MAQRTSCNLYARSGLAGRHLQSATIRAVGYEFVMRQHAHLRKCGEKDDGIVSGREQESIAQRPVWLIGAIAHLPEIDHREDIGCVESLTDITFSFALRHREYVAPDASGCKLEFRGIGNQCFYLGHATSSPPEIFNRSPVM